MRIMRAFALGGLVGALVGVTATLLALVGLAALAVVGTVSLVVRMVT